MLRDLRIEARITQEDLAKAMGRPQSYVSKIERGERLIDPVELRRGCEALGEDVSVFVQRWVAKLP
jgi:transcriptional regulator with XRE-family HTH domain